MPDFMRYRHIFQRLYRKHYVEIKTFRIYAKANPLRRPKCLQSAAPASPPNLSAKALAVAVLSCLSSVSGCLSHGWKLDGDVSTTTGVPYFSLYELRHTFA